MKSWIERFKAFKNKSIIKIRRFARSHPIQLSMLGFFLAIMGLQAWMLGGAYIQQSNARDYVQGLEEVTLQQLEKSISAGRVKELISHDIETGGVFYPESRSYLEVVDTNGKHTAFERNDDVGLKEEFGKMVFKNSVSHPVKFSTGTVKVPNAFSGLLTTITLLLALVCIMAVGQTLVTEVLGGHSFKPQRPDLDLTLDDVIGYDAPKRELREIKDQLMHADRYAERGIVAPRGLLLTGDPGVGKTMMAKAFANELNADFFVCTGADFAEMYVGVGPKRVRALFRQARMSSVALIFIDEIDALGSRDTMGNDSERLATLNAMLSEMDGINGNGRLIVVGATNHAHRLDPALRRPGRFDKSVHIPLPDTSTREGILRHYLRGCTVAEDVDLRSLALRTQGYSGAQLKNIIAEAKQLAARDDTSQDVLLLTQETLHRAQEIAMLGVTETQSDGADLQRVAVHELGHALAGYLHCQELHIEKVTVRGRGGALGYALSHPIDDQKIVTQPQMHGRLVMLLAGRAAEQVVLGHVSAGAADDLKKANQLARQMVLEYGMGEETGLILPTARQDGSEDLPQSAQNDIRAILGAAYDTAQDVVKTHHAWLQDRAVSLIKNGMLGHDALFVGVLRSA